MYTPSQAPHAAALRGTPLTRRLPGVTFHRNISISPPEVWLAIGSKVRRPQVDYPRLRFVRFSTSTLEAGAEEHLIEGVTVRVHNPAKTVADCFKYRYKIGLDVALEALRDCRKQGSCTNDELWRYAGICRVANVMRPYMEATA